MRAAERVKRGGIVGLNYCSDLWRACAVPGSCNSRFMVHRLPCNREISADCCRFAIAHRGPMVKKPFETYATGTEAESAASSDICSRSRRPVHAANAVVCPDVISDWWWDAQLHWHRLLCRGGHIQRRNRNLRPQHGQLHGDARQLHSDRLSSFGHLHAVAGLRELVLELGIGTDAGSSGPEYLPGQRRRRSRYDHEHPRQPSTYQKLEPSRDALHVGRE